MTVDIQIGLDFREKITPHLAVLLRFALWLTKDGKTATRLVRESLAEALRTWDVKAPGESYLRLYTIVKNRFIDEAGAISPMVVPAVVGTWPPDVAAVCVSPSDAGVSWLASEKYGELNYLKTLSEMPTVFRSAMMLSHLEGTPTHDLAGLPQVVPHAVDGLLDRGRDEIRAQLYDQLMDSDLGDERDNQSEAS